MPLRRYRWLDSAPTRWAVDHRNSPAAVATTEATVAPATATAAPAAPAVATATAAPVATAMAPATATVIAASWFERRTEPWRRQKSGKQRRKDRPDGNRNW
jgi:hypothetical protein